MTTEVWLCQSIILNLVGMSYGGDKRQMETSEFLRNMPITMCRRNGAFTNRARAPVLLTGMLMAQDADNCWHDWVQGETHRRLGFCAFVRPLLPALRAMEKNTTTNRLSLSTRN